MKDFGKELLDFKEENIFSTGFDDIDEGLKGVEKGSIITIGGRPAMGKTSFAISIFNNLLEKNKRVMWCSLEYSKSALSKRIIENKGKLNLNCTVRKNQNVIKKILEFYADKDFYILDKTNLSVEDIEENIKEKSPEVVFIDYIQLIEMKKAPNFTEAINYAVKEIKRIASEYGVIFVILTQLSRAVENRTDKRPLLSDIRNSSLLEEVSDAVIMIYRDEYYNYETEYKNQAEIIFRKNDFGSMNYVTLNFENCIFSNLYTAEKF